MTDSGTIWQRWQAYRPSKATWFWSCVACVVVTMAVGFTAGGWMTSGSAAEMAQSAADEAKDKLVAAICVNRFESSPDASAQMAQLKKAATWDRDYFIQKGGWVTVPGTNNPVAGAAGLCVKQLLTAATPSATPAGGSS